MGMVVRFLSGSLLGRDFEFSKDLVRVGDDANADIRIDPEEKDNAGARNRVIEVVREGTAFRIRSAGNREISSQGEAILDRNIGVGEEIRFGAWGPIFVVSSRSDDDSLSVTTPISVPGADDTASRARRKKEAVITDVRTVSGERPVGPKTVYMMIQDALGKAQGSEGGPVQRGTVFIQEMVTDTIQNATRSLKIGIGLLGAAFLVLAFVLVANIASTKNTLATANRAADSRVAEARTEMAQAVATVQKGRDDLAKETETLTRRLSEVEKTTGGDVKTVLELKARLRETEEKRRALESRMNQAMATLASDRAALAAERERLAREHAEEVERARLAASKPAEMAPAPEPVSSSSPAPATPAAVPTAAPQ